MSAEPKSVELRIIGFETERDLIGCLLRDPSQAITLDLSPEAFATQLWRTAFEAITNAAILDGDAFDIITIAERLTRASRSETDWLGILVDAHQKVHGGALAPTRALQIRSAYVERQARLVAQSLLDSIEGQGMGAVDNAIRSLVELGQPPSRHERGIVDSLRDALDEIEVSMESGSIPGIPSGLIQLDHLLGGFQDGDLTVIGARPSIGKTALLINFALNASVPVPVGIISSEQPHTQISKRMMAVAGKLNAARLRNGALLQDKDWVTLTNTVQHLRERAIRINDQSGIHVDEVMRQARMWKQSMGMKILFVDYIQRLKGGNAKHQKWERVEYIAQMLKHIARELCIPVVALAQVSREVEKRPNKRPHMGDLSDSSAIEKEADTIITIYRDEVYNEDSPDRGIAELLVEKNRHGPTGMVRTAWLGESMRFENLVMGDGMPEGIEGSRRQEHFDD